MTSTRRSVLFEKNPRTNNGENNEESSNEEPTNRSGIYPAGASPTPTASSNVDESERPRSEDLFSTKVMEALVQNYILSRF